MGLYSTSLQAQIIFTESLAPAIDTTKVWQGSIAPEINFKTEEELYKKIKIKIAKEGVTLKNYVTKLIEKDLKGGGEDER